MLTYEHHTRPLLPWPQFLKRLARHSGLAGIVVGISLVIGTVGFEWLAAMQPLDAFLNAAMLLGGMGPVGDFSKIPPGGKWFAALFALYAGIVFLGSFAVVFAPIVHRMLHKLHLSQSSK